MKFQFKYGYAHNMTVTVTAKDLDEADGKARDILDKRYEAKGWEPPVGWTWYSVVER